MKPIPQEWIKEYIDQLLVLADKMSKDGPMQAAILSRADIVMDLVKAWREDNER